MKFYYKLLIVLSIYFTTITFLSAKDYYFSKVSFQNKYDNNKHKKITNFKILKLSDDFKSLNLVDELIIPGYITDYNYDPYSNIYTIVADNKNTYQLIYDEKYFSLIEVMGFGKNEIIVNSDVYPKICLISDNYYPVFNKDNSLYLVNYYLQHRYNSGASNLGFKHYEILDLDLNTFKSNYLKPNKGFDEDTQLYFSQPTWLNNNSIIYSNSKHSNSVTYVLDVINENLKIIAGELLGVSYLGDKFVIASVTNDISMSKVTIYSSLADELYDLKGIDFLNSVFIFGNQLISMFLWEPGIIPLQGTPFLSYDLSSNEILFYDKNFELLNNGNIDDFIGFY